jgi:hypothetical protein
VDRIPLGMETICILPDLTGPVESSLLGPLDPLYYLVFRGGRGIGIVPFQDHKLTLHVMGSNHLAKFVVVSLNARDGFTLF